MTKPYSETKTLQIVKFDGIRYYTTEHGDGIMLTLTFFINFVI